MKLLFKILRILWPLINESAVERKGTRVGLILALIGGVVGLAVAIGDVVGPDVVDVPSIEAPVLDVEKPDIEVLAPEHSDEADILDVIEGAEVGGVVMVSPLRVAWDDSYDVPLVSRRSSMERFGGWAEYVARQRAYRGVR